jgi:hypothetical protein
MVIGYLYFLSVSVLPFKADTPLVVDFDAILSFSCPFQLFKLVRGWNSQVIQSLGIVNHAQLSPSHLLDVYGKLTRAFSAVNLFSFPILE